MTPSAVAIQHTITFIQEHLPKRAKRVLEVGCGDGALAAELTRIGLNVVAIDSSKSAVTHARRRGVRASVAEWPDFDDARRFDAIVFSRSLHHINPLPAAVRRARELLRPRGVVLVEDFAFNRVSPASAAWLYHTLRLLDVAGALPRGPGDFAAEGRRFDDPLAAWRAHHDHHLHTAAKMSAALHREFSLVTTEDCPYLYRYVLPQLATNATGAPRPMPA